jgi:AcrR family transcriptional regulator
VADATNAATLQHNLNAKKFLLRSMLLCHRFRMEPIPARILRPLALSCPSAPKPTPREVRTRAYIVEAARNMFTKYGTARVTLRAFAESAGLSQSTIRRHVCDMHHLFGLVLIGHLDEILAGISLIPAHHADRQARCRAEYRRLTRDHLNRITPLHALLVRHRFALPNDELDPLENQRCMIGVIMAGNQWEVAFDLLDGAPATMDMVEAMLGAEAGQAAAVAPDAAPVEPVRVAPSPRLVITPHAEATTFTKNQPEPASLRSMLTNMPLPMLYEGAA